MSAPRRAFLTLTAAALLCAGILAATVTTTDPRWWELYFSRLGMTDDFSAVLFNGGVIAAGATITVSAVMMRLWLIRSTTMEDARQRHAARVVPLFVALLGLSLTGIGVFPLSLDKVIHDTAANGMILSFAALLIVHRMFLRSLSRALNILAIVAGSSLILSMAAMAMGFINLTVFEAIGFSAILTWVHLLETHVKRLSPALAWKRSANSQQLSVSPIWGTRKVSVLSFQ